MNNKRLKIGEFSRLGRVTVRALRHYEEIDLLRPAIVDRYTGYRYYAVDQLQKIQSITTLKSLGFSLEEIRNLWEDDTHFPSVESLEEKIRICCEVIGPEMARLGCECPEPGYCYTIEHGGYRPSDRLISLSTTDIAGKNGFF